MRLTIALSKRNHRIFVLSYHSTSLLPGNTPYVRDEADLARFLRWLNKYLEFFFGDLNGVASTLPQLRAKATRIEQSHSLPGHDSYLKGTTTAALQQLPRRKSCQHAAGRQQCSVSSRCYFPPFGWRHLRSLR
jgi:hypothetical protein